MVIYTIVVTCNGAKWLDRCFGSLTRSSVPTKVLAIDNLSTDGTPQLIRSRYPTVEVLETGENLGFGRANNIGLARALDESADYVFLLNQDAWIEGDTIKRLIEATAEGVAILSPLHLNGAGDALDQNFANCLLSSMTSRHISDMFLGMNVAVYEARRVNAAAWFMHTRFIRQVGGFDPDFFMYGEDDDYMHRVAYRGYKIGVCPPARIYHDRQYREKKPQEASNANKVAFKVYLKDINQSLAGLVFRFLMSQVKGILKDWLTLRMCESLAKMTLTVTTIAGLARIVKSRRQAQQSGAFLRAS